MDTKYSDQTGKFLVRSSEGIKYIMVIYKIDSGSIMVELMIN